MPNAERDYEIQVTEESETQATFVVEPLERGYGITLGNTMRRLLMTAIPGTAISSIKVDGVQHEFSTVDGIIEDLADVVLNFKQVRFKSIEPKPEPVVVKLSGPSVFKAGQIDIGTNEFEILNPDLEICTLNGEHDVTMELRITRGRGYIPAERNKYSDAPLGTIFLDSIYNPVTKVTFNVVPLPASKDQHEKLTMIVTTDGATSPIDAVNHAATLLQGLADMFIFDGSSQIDDVVDKIDDKGIQLRNLLKKSIDEMELSVRSHNCLQAAGIHTIYELVTKEESEMLKFKNFGRKSLTELQEKLGDMGLYFGMNIDDSLVEN